MALQLRLTLLIMLLLVTAVFSTAGTIAFVTRDAAIDKARSNAEGVAALVARSVGALYLVPEDVEDIIGDHIAAQATLAAHLVDVAESRGDTPEEISQRLRQIVNTSVVDEFWITDPDGRAYIHTVPNVDFTFDPDPAKQPQASAFYPLLLGEESRVIQHARKREIDDRIFKYVGVSGVDKPRIVQVGYDASFLGALKLRTGFKNLIDGLLREGNVDGVWIVDRSIEPVAYGSVRDGPDSAVLSAEETERLRQALDTRHAQVVMDASLLRVAAPILDPAGTVLGAIQLHISNRELPQLIFKQVELALGVAIAVLIVGLIAGTVMARRLARPVNRVAAAARSIESGHFLFSGLDGVARRKDEIGQLARVFQTMARQVFARQEELDGLVRTRTRELQDRNTRLLDAQRVIEEDLETAQSVQAAMVPAILPSGSGFDAAARMTPARQVGGDFYDMFELPDGKIGLLIGDVSGKGVAAALFMAVSRLLIRSCAEEASSPADCLASANDRLCSQNPLELFVTCFYAVFDPASGKVIYSNGGHNPPFLIRSNVGVQEVAITGDIALGILDGMSYSDAEITLDSGDTLFLFTDGFTEAFDATGAEFSEAGLTQALSCSGDASAEAAVGAAIDAVSAFVGDAPQSDDLTCLAVRFCPAGGPQPVQGCVT